MRILFIALFVFLSAFTHAQDPAIPAAQVAKPYVTILTTQGDIVLELHPEKAPITVANFLAYIKDGYYKGTIFHRVIKDFMIQGGGFTESMTRKSTMEQIKNEADNGLFNNRGAITMARTAKVDSATSQFFINLKSNYFLNQVILQMIVIVLLKKLAEQYQWNEKIFETLTKSSTWTIKKANKVNLVSLGFQQYFSNKYPKQEFSYFTNGIDSVFIDAAVVLPCKVNEGDKPITILYAGNIGEGQGLHKIVPQLAKKMGDKIHIQLIGGGGRRSKLDEELKALGCNNVSLLAPVKRDELLVKYQEADILFLHLNDYDAFRKVLPSKVFEYGALGKPILAGVAGYAAEFISKEISNAKVFYPCNAEEAERALLALDLKTVSRSEFVDKFSRSNIMQKMTNDIIKYVK